MEKPDLTMAEVENTSKWCDCGHFARGTYKIDGKDSPIRFFKVESSNLKGIYCELCLVIANYIKNKKKETDQ